MTMHRRDFLQTAAVLAAMGSLSSCRIVRKPKPMCPFGEDFSNPEAILAIDVHAHVFNATDLQIKDFVRRIAIRQSGGLGKVGQFFAGPLQKFTWRKAPTVAEELEKLAELKPAIEDCDKDVVSRRLTAWREEKYEDGRVEMNDAVQQRLEELSMDPAELMEPIESLSSEMIGLRQIVTMPPTYEQFFETPEPTDPMLEESPEAITFTSAIKFGIEMLQYRYVSTYNYLKTYNHSDALKIDLMLPALVDYDWWLSNGKATRSSLPDQMALMKEIAVLTAGRVHFLVPFDPYRQVVADLGMDSGFSPIDMVKKSIFKYGAIGVKLYPPMGFAPYGNASVAEDQSDFWSRRSGLGEIAKRPDFPSRLDAAMKKLYDFCADNDVPVMGHSNQSNGPNDDFESLTGPAYWRNAAVENPDVSFSFGHFGGAGSSSSGEDKPLDGFLALMADDEASGKSRLVADASYFSNVIDDPKLLKSAIAYIYQYGDGDVSPAVSRLMYGADWKMLAAEAGAENYLDDFYKVIDGIETDLAITNLKRQFFGENAARFLGLHHENGNRKRLEAFYDREGMEQTPAWMEKVDDLT